jgi:restriction system protein
MDWAFGTRPISEGFVAIGWPEVGNLSKLVATREAFKKAVASAYPQKKPGAVPVVAGTLFKFATEMMIGDRVIYPSKVDRKVNLGFIDGPYEYDVAGDNQKLPNRRNVRWTHQFDRAEFSQSALHEIGSAVTLFQVKNNADEFLEAFEGKPLKSDDIDAETATEAAAITVEEIEDFVIKRLKFGLTPYQFEKFIAHLLQRMGYHARVSQQSGDGGVDVTAHKDELGFKDVIKVQCKQILTNVGQPDVAQLYGHVQANEHGLFVTLGGYTAPAIEFSKGKQNLRLIGGEELIRLIFNHYERFEPQYRMLLPMKKTYVATPISGEDAYD